MMKKYATYRCDDFVFDPFFIGWVRNPDESSDTFWTEFLTLYPEKKIEIDDARLIVQSFKFREEELPSEEKQIIWNQIKSRRAEKKPAITRRIIIAAACAASVIIFLGLWKIYDRQNIFESDLLSQYASSTPITSHNNDVRIILANDSNYTVTTDETDLLYDDNGQLLVNTKEVPQQATSGKAKEQRFNQVIVPWGKRTNITFADNTKLWLNAGSRAVYPVSFADDKREVFIEGEAFFEVAKDPSKPFIVKTGSIEVYVTGTSFNVMDYAKEDNVSVALVSGSVNVKEKKSEPSVLTPNQVITINKNTLDQTIREVDIYDYICWRDGLLRFKSETLENVLRKVERHYAMPVKIPDTMEQYKVTGKLDLKENIVEVLNILEKLAPINCKIIDHEIVVNKK